jgi:hypothetical protein
MASADDARAFPLSSLSPELRAMLTIPPASRAPPGDPDEGWGFTDDGRIDWRRAPAPPPAGDARASADALKGLARACLRRARASPPGPSDGAPRASYKSRLLERLRDDLRANRDPYLVLARSLSVLDRRCVDLHASVVARSERGGSPLLRDVLASASFAAALCGDSGPIEDSAGAWPLRAALDPSGLNLRNVVWHGFVAPPDASPELAALAWTLAASVPAPEEKEKENRIKENENEPNPTTTSPNCVPPNCVPPNVPPTSSRFARLAAKDAEMRRHFPECSARLAAGLDRALASSSRPGDALGPFLPEGWREAFLDAALELRRASKEDDSSASTVLEAGAAVVAVAAPALESALRASFARANAVSPSALDARPGEYFATLDGFGQAATHDVLLHPSRADGTPNALPGTLDAGARAALEDLFLRRAGPSLRAAHAHGGGVPSEGEESSVLNASCCVELLCLCVLDLCGISTALDAYAPLFHPDARVAEAIRSAVRATAKVAGGGGGGGGGGGEGNSLRSLASGGPRFTFEEAVHDLAGVSSLIVRDAERPGWSVRVDAKARSARDREAAAEREATLLRVAAETLDASASGSAARDFRPRPARALALAFLGRDPDPDRASTSPSFSAGERRRVRDDTRTRRSTLTTTRDPSREDPQDRPAGPRRGAECLRATATRVEAAANAHARWIDRLARSASRREARSNQRRQLAALLREQRALAAGLLATLVAAEALAEVEKGSGGPEADDEDENEDEDEGEEAATARRRLLAHAEKVRAACEAGQAVESASAAAALWETKAGRGVWGAMRDGGGCGGRAVEGGA